MSDKSLEPRATTVHLRGGSAIRRPLIVLAVCAVGVVGYVARDFLVPTAGAIVLALMLTPVASALERLRIPNTPAAAGSAAGASCVSGLEPYQRRVGNQGARAHGRVSAPGGRRHE